MNGENCQDTLQVTKKSMTKSPKIQIIISLKPLKLSLETKEVEARSEQLLAFSEPNPS
jgi:hypothetical protein